MKTVKLVNDDSKGRTYPAVLTADDSPAGREASFAGAALRQSATTGKRKAGFPRPDCIVERVKILNLRHRLDAFGANVLTDRLPILGNLDALNVRIEFPTSRAHRETTVITELRLLAAHFTSRHVRASSGYNACHNNCASYHSAQVSTRALNSGMITGNYAGARIQRAGH